MPPPKPSPKVNTLFSYFTKTPAKANTLAANDKPKESPITSNLLQTPKSQNIQQKKAIKLKKASLDLSKDYTLLDIVWAKLEGYPWWPAIICNAPQTNGFVDPDTSKIYVQFFDDPITQSWIKPNFIKKYPAPNEVPKIKDLTWKKGVEEANKALKLETDEREKIIIDISHLKEEEMELDEDSDVESDAKENCSPTSSSTQGTIKSQTKRRRIIFEDSDSDGSEFNPDPKKVEESDSDSISSGEDEAKLSEPEPEPESEPESPVKIPQKSSKRKMSSKVSKAPVTPKINIEPKITPSETIEKKWTHLSLEWLKPENKRDNKGRNQSHPQYDPRSLFIPESFQKNLTPAMRQWWEMKVTHFDTILFFKVGKFYELYHMDAVLGVQELGLTFMKGDFAHSGFPEIAYSRFSSILIDKGYRIARVEQTETPQMMEERVKKMVKPTKYDKVVNREICRITTKGTKTFSVLDARPRSASSNFLLALVEKGYDDTTGGETDFGVCFIDTSLGKFYLGQFKDDRHCSQLRTLLAHFPPAQLLHEKGSMTSKWMQLIKGCLLMTLKEPMKPGSQFWEASQTLNFLAEKDYFGDNWPQALKDVVDESDLMQRKPKEGFELALRSLGACIWYLRDCCIEDELLSLMQFEIYSPETKVEGVKSSSLLPIKHMVVDGVALNNLEVLENSLSGSIEGTLLETLDHCCTPFGKRLFRQWLCSPLYQPEEIVDRQLAVEELSNNFDSLDEVSKLMAKLPDLERLLSKIHAQGSSHRSKNHPDNRAIFYEEGQYSKRKINDFLSVLQGFGACKEIIAIFKNASLKSKLLDTYINELFPDLDELLEFFKTAFDHDKAKKEGKIIPSKGVDKEYDQAMDSIKKLKAHLDNYLESQKKLFHCKVTYFGSAKNRFQLEVPESNCNRATVEHDLVSQRKGFKRYWTEEIKEYLGDLIAAEEHRDAALQDIMRRIFENFSKNYNQWHTAVSCLSVVDCLMSLAQYNKTSSVPLCKPEFVTTNKPFLEISDGRHPTLVKLFTGDDLIPNDLSIGTQGESSDGCFALVTGPNMGGKSTLMRQAGLLVIMAQMGSFVPANTCHLTPVDRIFTRLGASDKIMAGESTFFIEVSETACVLKHASQHSLVLMDELGRGTSTYDGTGIACAVVQELSSTIQCRTLFSTHYHNLVEQFTATPAVKLGHMACMVENEDHPTEETITFLYKFVAGDCPKSYGFNAAKLAGISNEIVATAREKAKELERVVESRRLFKNFLGCKTKAQFPSLIQQLTTIS